jgi:hypothetical protein
MREDVCDLVVGPPPLASFANDQRRRIDHALFQPPQKGALADRKQASYCCIRESVPCGKVGYHCFLADHNTKTLSETILVTKSFLY